MADHEGTLQIEYDYITMKTKLLLKHCGGTFETLKLVKNSFFKIFAVFTPYWDYERSNAIPADSLGVYTSDNISKLSTIDKIPLECDVIDGSILCGVRNPVLCSKKIRRSKQSSGL